MNTQESLAEQMSNIHGGTMRKKWLEIDKYIYNIIVTKVYDNIIKIRNFLWLLYSHVWNYSSL